jgi:hypothetical protein
MLDASGEGLADAIAGYGGAASSDTASSNASTGTGMADVLGGNSGYGGLGSAAGGTSGDGFGGQSTGGAASQGDVIGGDGGSATNGAGGAAGDGGSWGSGNGDDGYVDGQSYASAAAAIDLTAFNQSIVMGANVLGNNVDMTIVGGSMTSAYAGDDSNP